MKMMNFCQKSGKITEK